MQSFSKIKALMIVQPNGTVLCEYKRKTHQNQSPRSHSPQDSEKNLYKKQFKEKLQKIKNQVIQTSRKLFKQAYKERINRISVENYIIFYRAKYNVLFIIITDEFSYKLNEIKQIIDRVTIWFNEKCQSMQINTNLVNRKMSLYQLGQFNKIRFQIDNFVYEQGCRSNQIMMKKNEPLCRENFIQERFKKIGEELNNREEILVKMKNLEQQKTRKLQRQKSFKNKSMRLTNYLRREKFFLYFCVLIVILLSFAIYNGWIYESYYYDEESMM